jgi:D-alanine transaminase
MAGTTRDETMGESEILYLNGNFMPLADGRIRVEDRGFELGDGVYEVVKLMNGRLVWLSDHLQRLTGSLAAIRLTEALNGHCLEEILPELVSRSGLDWGFVYLQVTRGYAPREFVFPAAPHPTLLAYARTYSFATNDDILKGTVLHPVEDLRWAHCDIKSTNLLAAVLAKEEAREAGADEALFMAPEGCVREGGSSNVFAVIDGVIRTHPLGNRILGGITRKYVIHVARALGYEVQERAFTLDELVPSAESPAEVFTASTLRDIMPVVRVGDRLVGTGRPGTVTLKLLDAFRQEQARVTGLSQPELLAG